MPAADALAVLDAIPAEQVPAAVLRLTARLVAEPAPRGEPVVDDVLTPDEAAKLLRADRRFVYRHARELGAVRLSRRKLRFKRSRIMRWLDARQARRG